MKSKAKLLAIILLLTTAISCRKEQFNKSENTPHSITNTLSIQEAQAWFNLQKDTLITGKIPIRWSSAKDIPTRNGNRIVLPLPGQPSVQGIQMGYRQLSIQINPTTNKPEANFIEVIPNYLYHQERQKVVSEDFTGQILTYDLNYKLMEGKVYQDGKQVGQIRPAQQNQPNSSNSIFTELSLGQYPTQGSRGKTAMAIQTCTWAQSYYVDSENELHILDTQVCQNIYFDEGYGSYNDSGINTYPPSGGAGGSTGNSSTSPPPPSNIPGEDAPKVNPKKMMDCFSNVKTEGAAFQVKVIVVEPLPGTTFNYGPNSFGHVAIQLTKVNGDQSVTQTIGFYGSGSGYDKMVSKSQMLDNGGMPYNMEASFFTDAPRFQKIIDYVSNPPSNYHYLNFNCAAFVYQAGKAASIDMPNPTIQVGYGGPGGAGYGMTPAGMANALREQKSSGAKNVTEGGGRVGASKGECN